MSEGILVFLAIVLLLKELGVFQAIKRFFNEVNDETKKDEKSSDEVKETVEEDEDNEINEENVGSEDNIGSEVDSNVEEASEESFEDNECSDKEQEKSEKEEPKKRTTFFDCFHVDPEVIPKTSMKNKRATPQPDQVIMFDFKPIKRKILDQPLECMRGEPTLKVQGSTVKNKYPRLTFIDKNTTKLEESPNDAFYCTSQDMPKIRMMPEKEQIEYLRMKKSHIASILL